MKRSLHRLLVGLTVAVFSVASQMALPALVPTSSISSASATDLTPGLVPVAELASYSGDNGFVVRVTNFDPAYSWSLDTTDGTVAGRLPTTAGALFSIAVRNLPLDSSATLTITTHRSGYTDESISVVGYSKKTGLTPTVSDVNPYFGGYTVQITNFSSDYAFRAISTNGTASLSSSGLISVTMRNGALTDVLSIYSTRTDYTDGILQITGSASPANDGLVPIFGDITTTENTIDIPITNYDPAFLWEIDTQGDGTVNFDASSGLISVSDLYAGQPLHLRVATTRFGYLDASASTVVYSTFPALIPDFYFITRSSDSFALQLTNYNTDYQWEITTDVGTLTKDDNQIIRVSGLAYGQSATVTMATSRLHTTSALVTTTNYAANGTFTPIFGNPVRTSDGFAAQITNYDANYSWSVYTESATGSPSISDGGMVTVTNLSPGQEVTVHVVTTRANYDTNDVQLTSSALRPAINPTVGTVTPQSGGFFFDITNFDSNFNWRASANSGSAVVSSSGRVTVSGLSSLATASVTLTSSREGHLEGSATIEGQALAAPSQDSIDATDAARAAAEAAAAVEKAVADYRAAIEAARAEAQAKADAQVAAKLSADKRAIAAILASPSLTTSAQIRRLTSAQIALIPAMSFKRFSNASILGLSPKQAAGITVAQLRALSGKQLAKLSPAAIGALQPETIGALPVAKLKALTKAQVKKIWLAQLIQLDADQRKALKR